MIICGIQSYSLNCSQKEQGGSSSLHVRMYALVLAPCSNCGGPLCKGTFSTGFSGLVNEPAKQSKTVGHSIETMSTGVAFCSYGYCRNHVGTLNGAISGIHGAGHGMAERDAAGCPSKSVACPRAWVLNPEFGCKNCILCADSLQSSVSKFSYCVQMCVCVLRFQGVLASVFVDSNCCALVLASMSYDRKMNSVFTCIF